MNTRAILFISVILLLTTSCKIAPPTYKGYQNFHFDKLEDNLLRFSVDVNIDNPNFFGVKVKKSFLDVSVAGNYIGKAKISKKIKIKRKRLNTVTIPFELELEKGAMFKLLRYVTKKDVEVKLEGAVRGSTMGIPKKIKIDETKKVSLKDLNLNLGL